MKNRQPLFHVVKRENAGVARQLLAYVAAVALALAVGAVLLAVQGVDPLTFYRQMLTMGIPGSRYPWRAVENFIRLFVPLLIVSLALALAFKMRFWNIGGEGQFIMGAFWAGFAAMKLGESLPRPAMVLVMAAAGALGGGLYGVFVAALKVRFGTNETLLTLMLNYIALYFLQFFAETKAPWNFFLDPQSARPKFAKFPEGAQMLTVPIGSFHLNLSLVAALALCALLYWLGGMVSGALAMALPLAALAGLRGPEFAVLISMFATPTAVASYSMASQMGGNPELAASAVTVTTLLSAGTMFCWIFLFKSLGMF